MKSSRQAMQKHLHRELGKLAGKDIVEGSPPYIVLADSAESILAAADVRLAPADRSTTGLPEMVLGLIVVVPAQRRCGYATRLLKLLGRVADASGWAITGVVRPWDRPDDVKPPMGSRALRRWYRKHGFVIDKAGNMVRMPR